MAPLDQTARRPAWVLCLGWLLALCPLPAAAETQDPLVIGVYAVGADAVVDGDTIRLLDGGSSVRVLGLDTEEVFRNEEDRAAAAADFAAYAKAKRGDSKRPVKYGTPAGAAAKAFVEELFRGVKSVRLERDEAGGRDTGTYGRRLAHVILLKARGEVNLSAAVIRAGHSPYFTKYGHLRRYHRLYARLEQEALRARRGIWGTDGPDHYPDYPERCRWWRERAQQVERWRKVATKPDHITLGQADADRKLTERLGKPAVVFGLFDRELEVKSGDRRILLLSHVRRRGLPLVFFSEETLAGVDMDAFSSLFVTVRGTITQFRGRPQIAIEKAEQISTR